MENLTLYTSKDLEQIFPFGKTKFQQLLNANVLPVVKIGRDYLSSPDMINNWLLENSGKEIFY